MAKLPQSKTVTYDEWLDMPEVDDAIEEVVNGEVRIMPPAKALHAKIIAKLNRALDRQLDPNRTLLLCSTFGLVIRKNPLTSRVPDLAIFQLENLIEEDGYFHSAPQLAVEVLSPANTPAKLREKLADYAEIGVPEVWVLSPESQTVEILILENHHLVCSGILGNGDLLKPMHFAHVQVDIAQIWPD